MWVIAKPSYHYPYLASLVTGDGVPPAMRPIFGVSLSSCPSFTGLRRLPAFSLSLYLACFLATGSSRALPWTFCVEIGLFPYPCAHPSSVPCENFPSTLLDGGRKTMRFPPCSANPPAVLHTRMPLTNAWSWRMEAHHGLVHHHRPHHGLVAIGIHGGVLDSGRLAELEERRVDAAWQHYLRAADHPSRLLGHHTSLQGRYLLGRLPEAFSVNAGI
ncbi:unnamed protein product [Cuscuta campestris]|uniref:Uncharacterized protein n=1 Tax=Cuscuta campestris TaxID=132261 RepID=A0A484NPU5_9ASTE|nr:unnamed protein product [Cuscuta campestris]